MVRAHFFFQLRVFYFSCPQNLHCTFDCAPGVLAFKQELKHWNSPNQKHIKCVETSKENLYTGIQNSEVQNSLNKMSQEECKQLLLKP